MLARVRGLRANDTASINGGVGIGYDSTTAVLATSIRTLGQTASTGYGMPVMADVVHYPAVGRHTYVWLEYAVATGATTWYGDATGTSYEPFITAGIDGVLSGR